MNKLLLLVNISLGTSSNQSFGEGKMEDIPTKSGRGRQKTLEEIVYKYPILHMLFVSVIKLIHKCLYPTLNNLCSFSLA